MRNKLLRVGGCEAMGADVDQAMPNGIHIPIVVYGRVFSSLLAEITLANLAAVVREIPEDLRQRSKVRIITTAADIPTINASPALPILRQSIVVEILDAARIAGHDKHGDYGPMVESQRIAVVDAARENAAIFFIGPDLIVTRGAFALFVERLKQGYRLIVGPGPRVKRDEVLPFIRQQISSSPDGTFALEPRDQANLLFQHWHPINDKFLLESDEGIWWKAYVCYRPAPTELFFRLIQGPTFVAWPRRQHDEFDGFIDHSTPELCCTSWREIYVITDSDECLPVDLTDDARLDIMELADFPKVFLLREFFDHHGVRDLKLMYAMRTSRVHVDNASDPKTLAEWTKRFSRAIDPLILIAMLERTVTRRLGRTAGRIFRRLSLLNTHTLAFLLSPVSARLVRRWQEHLPLEQARLH